MKSLSKILIISLFSIGLSVSCTLKEEGLSKDESFFKSAQKSFDRRNYEMAIVKLREFRAKYPYSQYIIQVDLMIADAYFKREEFEEAVFEYEQFMRLHPDHPEREYVMYQIGSSYWKEAPEEVDREQEFTQKAISEWQKLLVAFPNSKHATKTRENIKVGHQRIALSHEFVAKYYCRKKLYHACIFRSEVILKDHGQEPKLRYRTVARLGKAYESLALRVANEKTKPRENVMSMNQTPDQLRVIAKRYQAMLVTMNKAAVSPVPKSL